MKSTFRVIPLIIVLITTACDGQEPKPAPGAPPPNAPQIQGDANTARALQALKDEWGPYWGKRNAEMAQQMDRAEAAGNETLSTIYMIIAQSVAGIQTELKVLMMTESVATLVTDDANKLLAAQTLHDYYSRFNEDIIDPQLAVLRNQVTFLRTQRPADVPVVQEQFIQPLERMKKDFIVTRTAQWKLLVDGAKKNK